LQELAAGDSAIGESPQLQAALLRGLTAEELWQRAVAGARDRNRQAPMARPQPEPCPMSDGGRQARRARPWGRRLSRVFRVSPVSPVLPVL
jgi:hypothetical protein